MRIAVIGAGPAGSRTAARLAESGHQVLLIDRSFVREKPCGGGVPWVGQADLMLGDEDARSRTALSEGPSASVGDATSPPAPGVGVRRVIFEGPSGERAEMNLPHPVAVFSRRALDRALLEQASARGVNLIEESVVGLARAGAASSAPASIQAAPGADQLGEWVLSLASGGTVTAEHVVGADGARSVVRRALAAPFAAEDLSQAVGWYAPGRTSDAIVLRFDANLPGYAWIFPRTDHLAIGACAPLTPGAADGLWETARRLREDYGIPGDGLTHYSALIPTLGAHALDGHRAGGAGWSLVGDAAGTVDPLTREGIRHGLRSAELLAETFEAGDPESYDARWRAEFLPEFLWAAAHRERFFAPTLTSRLVRCIARSESIRRVAADLILGAQDYLTLKRRLIRAAPVAGLQLGLSLIGLRTG